MNDATKNDALTVLCALAAAGLRPQRPTDLATELDIAPSKMTRLLHRLVEAGCATQTESGSYVIGPIIEVAVRRINEDNAATAERLHDVMERINPQPPGVPPTDGEMFLGLRYLEEVRAEQKLQRAMLARLLKGDEGKQPNERIG